MEKKKVLRFKTLMSFPILFHTVGKVWDLWSPLLKVFRSNPTPCSSCCQSVLGEQLAQPAVICFILKGGSKITCGWWSCIKHNQILISSAGPSTPLTDNVGQTSLDKDAVFSPLKHLMKLVIREMPYPLKSWPEEQGPQLEAWNSIPPKFDPCLFVQLHISMFPI